MRDNRRPIAKPGIRRLLDVFARNDGCDLDKQVGWIWERAGISADCFYRYVRGETALGGYAEARIAAACKISVEELRGIMFGKCQPSRRKALRRETIRRKSCQRKAPTIRLRSSRTTGIR
jgi:hypothetical protein